MDASERAALPPLERALGTPLPRLVDPELTRRALTTHTPPRSLVPPEPSALVARALVPATKPPARPAVPPGEPPAEAQLARRILVPPAPPAPAAPPRFAGRAATPGQLLGGVEAVPEPVRRVAEAATSRDLSDVAVVRSAEAARAAAAAGAMAFTSDAVVHMPRSLGPLQVEPARTVLTHELVHVAQQRARGGKTPPEDTREGRALEAEARRVAAAPPPPLPSNVAAADGSGAIVFSPPPGGPGPGTPAPPAPMQRQPLGASPPAPEPEAVDLDDLARRLYPRIRPYLRKELSLDRERSAAALRATR